jgi:tRNA threonylcarbamoyladenosine biosynthesis protein TsaE
LIERTTGPHETESLGARLARRLEPGDVVLVRGELGTGKTTLIRGACRELGVTGPVTSPTFTIGHRYRGRLPISHLDLYRLPGLATEEPGLLDDYLTPDAVAFIEWSAVLEPELAGLGPDGIAVAHTVELRHAGGDEREVRVAEADRER